MSLVGCIGCFMLKRIINIASSAWNFTRLESLTILHVEAYNCGVNGPLILSNGDGTIGNNDSINMITGSVVSGVGESTILLLH